MPKTTAPLFSVAASGAFARTIVFRTMRVGNRAQVRPFSIPAATHSRLQVRAAGKAARDAWRAADLPTKAAWQTYAVAIGLPTFAAFLQEWMRQRPASLADLQIPAT